MKKLRGIWGVTMCIYGVALYIKYFQKVSEGWNITLHVLSGSLCIIGISLIVQAIRVHK
ncbi:hypothetical protein [Lysinibacillus xylanilyticus]|uniref:hypothetical protein n=1 Tax=Lysinibacillus xylanilyticus TaxID=582475 RepID=UPI0038117A72